jgi:zinc transport system substrate-binding protein
MRYIISLLLTSTAAATAALAEVPKVVTDIPPVHSLAAAVMQGVGEPVLLLERGASEHNYQLKPSQAAEIAEAGLVVWIGPELTPWLDSALENRPDGAALLTLLEAEGTYRQEYGAAMIGKAHDHGHEDHGHEEEAGHDHGHDHGHDDHAAHDDHGHDHSAEGHVHEGLDPHAWLDPANGKAWAGVIAAELSRLDPENAATYAANAAAAVAAIEAADAEAAALLAPAKGRPFVAFHDAYGYFVGHYGLTMAGTVALGDAAAPGAQRLAELREMVETGQVACLFPEAQHDPALVTQLAEGTGAKVGATLDPAGAVLEPGPGLYPALLVGTAKAIAGCGG